MKFISVITTPAWMVLLLLFLPTCKQEPEVPPNILLITVDTLRPDRLGCYGCPIPLSPAIDALAEEGILFKNCFAHASFTLPSLASLMTGQIASKLGVKGNTSPLPESSNTLASALKERGYRTAAFVSNFNLRPKLRFDIGFDHYDADLTTPEPNRPDVLTRNADKTTEAALAWLRSNSNEKQPPFFMWIHYQDPHGGDRAQGIFFLPPVHLLCHL